MKRSLLLLTFVTIVQCFLVQADACDGKKVCMEIGMSGRSIDISTQGLWGATNGFASVKPQLLKIHEVNVVNEKMRTRKSTNDKFPTAGCTRNQAGCYANRDIHHNMVNAGSYTQTYDVLFEVKGERYDYWKSEVPNMKEDNDISEFIRDVMIRVWLGFQSGYQYHHVHYSEGNGNSECPYVFGVGKGYTDMVESCHTICTDLGCDRLCWDNYYKPKGTCESSSPFATVPSTLLVSFTKPDGSYLGYGSIRITERTINRPASATSCPSTVKAFLQALLFLPDPKLTPLFAVANIACTALGFERSEAGFTTDEPKQSVPENTVFLPKWYNAQHEYNLDTVKNGSDSKVVYYACEKCWPSDLSQYSSNSSQELGYSFPTTEEGKQEGNHCSLCFLQHQLIDQQVNFEAEISSDCKNLGYFVLPIEDLVKILPPTKSSELQEVQDKCFKMKNLGLQVNAAKEGKTTAVEVATVAGITFGGSTVLFLSLGMVMYRKLRQKNVDPIIESFQL